MMPMPQHNQNENVSACLRTSDGQAVPLLGVALGGEVFGAHARLVLRQRYKNRESKPIEAVSKDSMLALQRYPWPGNVRELCNVVERAVIVATGPRLTIKPPTLAATAVAEHSSTALVDVERDLISARLERAKWRGRGVSGAAYLLAMKPSTVDSRLVKRGIDRPRTH